MGLTTLYSCLPGFDCGACGSATCKTHGRRVVSGKAMLEDCPIISLPEYKVHRARFKVQPPETFQSDSDGSREEKASGGVTYIHPCAEDASKVTAETQLRRRYTVTQPLSSEVFDPSLWDWMLSSNKPFQNFRCSERLGVARIETSGMTIMVFKDGRVNVRAARDEAQALAMIRIISRSIWGSVICACGNTALDCAGGACVECSRYSCPALDAEPYILTDAVPHQAYQEIIGAHTVGTSPFTDTLSTLGFFISNVARALKCSIDRVKDLDKRLGNDVGDMLFKGRRRAAELLVSTPDGNFSQSAMTALGALIDLQRIHDGVRLGIHSGGLTDDASDILLPKAVQVLAPVLEGLLSGHYVDQTTVLEQFDRFHSIWKAELFEDANAQVLSSLHKIAANATYLGRALGSDNSQSLMWLMLSAQTV